MSELERFRAEQELRLEKMRTSAEPAYAWPRGCRGSRLPWLVFLGPSPGGNSSRDEDAIPHWNQPFTAPLQWSRGFKQSMQPILNILMEGTTEDEARLLYAVYNFDSVQNPQAANVPSESMSRGAGEIVKLLEAYPPRLIVPMERRSFDLLRATLLNGTYTLSPDFDFPITIPINDNPQRLHRTLFGYRISGRGFLCGTVVVKFPQHPARIFRSSYAEACAIAVRNLFTQLA